MHLGKEYLELIKQVKDDADKWAIILKAYNDNRIDWDFDSGTIMLVLNGEADIGSIMFLGR